MRRFLSFCFVLLLAACGSGKAVVSSATPTAVETVVAVAAPAAAPSQPQLGGRILYVQGTQLWLYSRGTSQPLDLGGPVSKGVWSHDGSKIAFIRRGESFSDLYVVTVATRQTTRVTFNTSKAQQRTFEYVHQTTWADSPSWSPDDSELVFMGQPAPATTDQAANPIYEYPFTLFRYKLKLAGRVPPTTDDKLPIDSASDLESPAWSPDGKLVAYVDSPRRDGERRIMRLNVADGTAGPFPGIPTNSYDPTWSPDGSQLAFAAVDSGATDIWVVNTTGGAAQRVTQLGRARSPVWSPDGTMLAFVNVANDAVDLFVVDLPGGMPPSGGAVARQVTKNGHLAAGAGLSWTR